MSDNSLILDNVRVPGHDGTVSIRVEDGIVAAIGGDAAGPGGAPPRVDGRGQLVLPALVDGHVHLDKTLAGLPWMAHPAGPDRSSRIETEAALRASLPPVAERASSLVRQCIAAGTGAIRCHVDVTPETGLAHVEALLAVREAFAGQVAIQLVAFPQTGVLCQPGSRERLDAALAAGVEHIGGIDPITFDGDAGGQLDLLFDLAGRHHAGVDVHVHDPGPRGLQEIAALTERCLAQAMAGRVTVSHGFALGAAEDAVFVPLAEAMAEAGVSLATHGGGASPLPPVKRLREAGVVVFAGNDNVRDTWNPFGSGDMLERAMLLAWRSGYRTDGDLEIALDCATAAGAAAMGLAPHGAAPGALADLVTVDCETVAEAVVSRPPRGLVIHRGRVVARDGVLLA